MNTPPINLQTLLSSANGPAKSPPIPGEQHGSFLDVQQAVEYANQANSPKTDAKPGGALLVDQAPSQLPEGLKQTLRARFGGNGDDDQSGANTLPALLVKAFATNRAALDDATLSEIADEAALDEATLSEIADEAALDEATLSEIADEAALDEAAKILDHAFTLVDDAARQTKTTGPQATFNSASPHAELAAAIQADNNSDQKETPAAGLNAPQASAVAGVEIPGFSRSATDPIMPGLAPPLTPKAAQPQTAAAEQQAEADKPLKTIPAPPGTMGRRLQATTTAQPAADFEPLVARALGWETAATVTEKQPAEKNAAGLQKAAKNENTVSLTMGEQFKEVVGLRDSRSASPIWSDTSLRPTPVNQETVAAKSAQVAEARVVLGSGDPLLPKSDQDETSLQTSLNSRSEQGGPLAKGAGPNNVFEPLLAETGNAGRPQQNAGTTGESGTIRLPSGTMVPESQVVNHVVEKISLNVGPRNESSTITIKMHPEELGELKLKLEVTNDSVKAQLLAQTLQSQEILEKHVYRLREALENQGLKLDDLEVSVDSGREEQNQRLFNEQWGQASHRGFGNDQNQPMNPEENEPPDQPTTISGLSHDPANGRVSMRV